MDYRERELSCPVCRSADTKLFVHPETDQVVHADGMYLATCRSCDHVFSLNERGVDLLAAALPVGTTLHIATPCPCCGYNLQTLQIGDVCPECGEVIRRLVQRANAEKQAGIKPRRVAAALFLAGLAIAIIGGRLLKPNRVPEFVIVVFAVYGVFLFSMRLTDHRAKADEDNQKTRWSLVFVYLGFLVVLVALMVFIGPFASWLLPFIFKQ